MATRAMVGFTPPGGLDFVVEGLDPDVLGQQAVIEVVHVVTVHDSRPVHAREVLWSEERLLDTTDLIVPITLTRPVPYAYDGVQVAIHLEVGLKFPKTGWFSSDRVLAEAVVPLPPIERTASPDDAALMEPRDDYAIEPAFGSLGPAASARLAFRSGAYAVAVVGGLLFTLYMGWCFLYFVWLVATAAGGKLLYDNAMSELAGYAELSFGFVPPLHPDDVIPIHQLLDGLPRVDIERPRLRIVACNLERGQYKRGSGTDVRTVSFSDPIGAVVLYDEEVDRWPQGRPLADVFTGDVDFGPAFAALVPPCTVTETHGVGLRWEAQLIVPDLVDVELEGPVEVWHWPSDDGS